MLLGFPIPKLSIRELTDIRTKKPIREIIDGQQRSMAIRAFYHNEFKVSRNSELIEARGCTYANLPPELQEAFLSFRLDADLFTGAKDEEIIELFRRINSHTVTLNGEEKRHAQFQGEMKWFVYNLARLYSPLLERYKVMTVKQLARMQDTKLIADVIFALENGIRTTKSGDLNALYKRYDGGYPRAGQVQQHFRFAIDAVQNLPSIVSTPIVKHYNFYALLLAIMHAKNPVPALSSIAPGGRGLKPVSEMEQALLNIAEALSEDEPPQGAYKALWLAADSKTNTEDHRRTRFRYFLEAVSA